MVIILVRHAMPLARADRQPSAWPLSDDGRRAARRLAPLLPYDALWLSSSEAKARETLRLARPEAAGRIRQDARFDEVCRVEPYDDDFVARRRTWVGGRLDDRHDGWEQPHQAAARFEAGVATYGAGSSSVVVATHGMVLTAWRVHERGLVAESSAPEFWERLGLPCVLRVSDTAVECASP